MITFPLFSFNFVYRKKIESTRSIRGFTSKRDETHVENGIHRIIADIKTRRDSLQTHCKCEIKISSKLKAKVYLDSLKFPIRAIKKKKKNNYK